MLLERLGIAFNVFDPDIDESAKPGEQPDQLVLRLSQAKAYAYRPGAQDETSLVIGSDQVGFFSGEILTKPGTQERAVEQLALVSGMMVEFFTAVCLHNPSNGYIDKLLHTTRVYFRELTREEISHYVANEQPLHSCGSFQVEGPGIALTEKIESDDPTGLIGLPLIHLSAMLRKADWPQSNPS